MANHSWIVVCSLLLIGAVLALGEPTEPDAKNASSSMYFHQLFSQETTGNGDDAGPEAVSTVNHPSSIQAVNQTVNGGNLSSSETQHYYGYEPTGGINKRHVHYPPVPMDVINSDDSANDDYDNDEGDDADYDDEDDGQQNNPQQGSEDDGEDRDDDFDHAASFAIPKIDTNHKGCKTVYKEIQTVPGKVKSADDDFDADFGFKRRRRKRSAPNSATASYVVSRECHYSDSEGKERNKLAKPLPPPAAAAAGEVPSGVPSPVTHAPTSGSQPDLTKPKVTGESRFVPINADPWRPRNTRGIPPGFGDRLKTGGPLSYDYKVASTPFMEADDATVKKTQAMFDQDGQNSQHFHKYPYPHYHIYYNRKGSSVLDENALYNGNNNNNNNPTKPTEEADADSEADNAPTYDSPNSYFEFTNPNEGGNDGGNDGGDGANDSNQDDDYDDGGDNSEGDEDDGMAAAPVEAPLEAESRATRSRRGAKGQRSTALPLPPTLSPSHPSSTGLQNDDAWDFTISGPNYYKTGTYEAGNGKKPKKYTYNFFKSEDPSKIDDSQSSDSAASTRNPHTISHEIDHSVPTRRSDDGGDGDYNIHYGSGDYKEFNDEYDSNKKQPEHSDEAGNGNDGQYQDNDGQQEEEEDDWGVDGFPQI